MTSFIISILFLIIILLSYISYNLLRKNEILEDYIYKNSEFLLKMKEIVDKSSSQLKILDNKGSFSSDDEIGFFFEYVKNIQDMLETFVSKNIKTL